MLVFCRWRSIQVIKNKVSIDVLITEGYTRQFVILFATAVLLTIFYLGINLDIWSKMRLHQFPRKYFLIP